MAFQEFFRAGTKKKYMKTSRVYIEIALKELSFILKNVYPLPISVFESDPFIQRATVLSLIIIGEECKKVNEKIKLKYTNIEWGLMAGMRNKMVHNYDGIDTAIVWKTVKEDLKELQEKLAKILNNEHELLNDE